MAIFEAHLIKPSKFIFCFGLVTLLFGCTTLDKRHTVLATIHDQFAQERAGLISSIESMKTKSDTSWAESDVVFCLLWLDGTDQEQKGQYDDAISLYQKALNTPRYEMESYDVQLAIGRALFLSGKNLEARNQLRQYIKNANDELNGEINTMWVASDEARETIKKNITFAKWLLRQAL